jgi:hypothetical protein
MTPDEEEQERILEALRDPMADAIQFGIKQMTKEAGLSVMREVNAGRGQLVFGLKPFSLRYLVSVDGELLGFELSSGLQRLCLIERGKAN